MFNATTSRRFALCLTLAFGAACTEDDTEPDGDSGIVGSPGWDAGFSADSGTSQPWDGGGFNLPDGTVTNPFDAGPVNVPDGGVPSDGAVPADGAVVQPADGGTSDAGPVIPPGSVARADGLKNGPYTVKSTTTGFRNGEQFADSTLWWPENGVAPYPYIGIVPGWVSTEGDIKDWGPFLASHGIVAMTSSTNSPITDLPANRADALLDILKSITEENTRAGSPLMGKLDTSRQAVMGWSMGGGGALLAAERTPSLKAAISLCGWNPGYDYGKVKVPSLMFAATPSDFLAGGQSQGFYDTIPASTPKELFEINNAGHWEGNSPKNQGGVVGLYGVSFLKVFLVGDERWRPFLKEKPTQAADFRTNL